MFEIPGFPVQISHFPWNHDQPFIDAEVQVARNTIVDIPRLYELWTLTAQVAKLPEGDILEVGVWQGGSGALIAAQAARLIPNAKVFLCDTFKGVPKTGPEDLYDGGEHADTDPSIVQTLVQRMGLQNTEIMIGVFPDDTGDRVADRKFRMVHLDVDVYLSAKDCVEWIWPRLIPGGVIVFDDYGHIPCGLTWYVDRLGELPDRFMIYNLNGHAILIKRW